MMRSVYYTTVCWVEEKSLTTFLLGVCFIFLLSCSEDKNQQSYSKYIERKNSNLSADSAKKQLALSKTKQDSLYYLLLYIEKQSKIRFEICLPEIKQSILLSRQLDSKSDLASAYYFMSVFTGDQLPHEQYADSLRALALITNDPISKMLVCNVGASRSTESNDQVGLLRWLLKSKQILDEEAPYARDLQLRVNARICEILVKVNAFDLLKDQLAASDTSNISKEMKNQFNNVFGNYYFSRNIPDSALIYVKKSQVNSYSAIGWIKYYRMINRPDKLWAFLQNDLKQFDRSQNFLGLQFNEIGKLLLERGSYDSASFFFREAIQEGMEKMEYPLQAQATNQLIKTLLAQGLLKEAMSTADKNIAFTKRNSYHDLLAEVYGLKKECFLLQKKPYEALEASENQRLYMSKADSATNPVQIQRVLLAENQERLKKSLQILNKQESIKKWVLMFILVLSLLLISVLTWTANLRRDKIKQIAKFNDELQLVNTELDKRVQIRTEELEERNKKLAAYAFMNAHNLRSPVSSILGLVNLYKSKILNQDEKDAFVDQIDSQTQKLDAVVREIQKSVE
jgi:hypothetical protein